MIHSAMKQGEKFNCGLKCFFDTYAPIKEKRVTFRRKVKWFDDEGAVLNSEKGKLENVWKHTRDQTDYDNSQHSKLINRDHLIIARPVCEPNDSRLWYRLLGSYKTR